MSDDMDEVEQFSDSSSSVEAFFEVEGESVPSPADVGGVVAYRYEPYLDEQQSDGEEDLDGGQDTDNSVGNAEVGAEGGMADRSGRQENTEWCSCGHCTTMPTTTECVCCHEVQQINVKQQQLVHMMVPVPGCITLHPGLPAVCLDPWGLQCAYYHYRQDQGPLSLSDNHE
ncbi:uncharacterized protein LOC118423930 [Branchiostoma floridae]|uniref:Uncharacterized protein LOC118423930 n=1 Tax=Branchiostoma floridae TaxID=7739 RepID=A0A9J7LTS3_BRAFL|nr:uncharacterized protein LOC118423930 [Branchiostoma floridae]